MGKTNIRSKAAIEKYLTAQRESGLTVECFCKRHHIALSTFWNWRKRFKATPDKQSAARFVKIVPVPVTSSTAIEIRTGPFAITISAGCDPELLRNILSVVGELSSGCTHAA